MYRIRYGQWFAHKTSGAKKTHTHRIRKSLENETFRIVGREKDTRICYGGVGG